MSNDVMLMRSGGICIEVHTDVTHIYIYIYIYREIEIDMQYPISNMEAPHKGFTPPHPHPMSFPSGPAFGWPGMGWAEWGQSLMGLFEYCE